MAAILNVPCVCVAVVEDSTCLAWPPTDRSAAFKLEALSELQPLLLARGAALWTHVQRDGCRAAVEMSLAAKASLVVTDEHFGIEPHAAAAARVAKTGTPLWLCDTTCTVPSRMLTNQALVGGNAGFLRASASLRAERLTDEWFPPPAPPPTQKPPDAPAWAVDLSGGDAAVDVILAEPSRRDATVPRVKHTKGGPSAAAARWSRYVSGGGLRSYAAQRNNPLAADGRGASRMSAYVNLGMIDPYVMARDATAAKADKYLSEFAGFRESAHLWCMLHPGGYKDATVAVPTWARGQMRKYADGANDASTPSLSALERGETGDAYWDDCQRSLVAAGELHNNVRMAWGKAIPAWHAALLPRGEQPSPSASVRLQAALNLLIRLNDRFALDGGSPPSYGGLLWCLGWRDRPGQDGCPTHRPTSVMASKIKPGDLLRKAMARQGKLLFKDASVPQPAPTPTQAAVLPEAMASSSSSNEGERDAKRPRPPQQQQGMWHFLNRESAAALAKASRDV